MDTKVVVQKKALGERIKQLAAERGLSLSGIESTVGYSLGMITRWTNASNEEEFGIFSKLATMASLLSVSTDELLGLPAVHSGAERADKAGILSCMIDLTRQEKLDWTPVDWKAQENLPYRPLLETDGNYMLARAWTVTREQIRFLLASFSDDPDDTTEPMEFRLYALAGHGIPPSPVQAGIPELQSLYIAILLQSAHQSFLADAAE